MKWFLGAICAALVVATSQSALAFKNGHQLLEIAKSENEDVRFVFTTYVIGVAGGAEVASGLVNAPPLFCVSGKITNSDMADAVRIWLRTRPDSLDLHAAGAVVVALGEHFPCNNRP